MKVEYLEPDDHYGDFWAVVDDNTLIPVYTAKAIERGMEQKYRAATVAYCYSEAIAQRVAELVSGDQVLADLIKAEQTP